MEWCKCHLFAFKHLFISSEAELMASDMFLAHNKNRLPCKSPKNPKSSSCCPWKHTHHQRHQRSRRYAEPYVPAPGRGDLVLNPGALREVSANPSLHKRFNKSTIHPRIIQDPEVSKPSQLANSTRKFQRSESQNLVVFFYLLSVGKRQKSSI